MPLPGLPPAQRRLLDFMAALPQCPHGCRNSGVYPTPTFRPLAVDDTIDGQVAEIIERYEREAAGMLRRHLAEDHEATYRAWLDAGRPAIADHLTETLLPAGLRAAGIRFEWGQVDG